MSSAEKIVVQEQSRTAALDALNLQRVASRVALAQRFLALAAEEIAAAQGLAVAELDDAGLLTELLATGNQITLAKLTAPDVGALERRAEQLRAQSYGVNHAAAA
jgi:hypothetical protein